MAQTIHDVVIRFRVEAPRAGSMPSPTAGALGTSGTAALGLPPGPAGDTQRLLLEKLDDLTEALNQLRLTIQISGAFNLASALSGGAGAGPGLRALGSRIAAGAGAAGAFAGRLGAGALAVGGAVAPYALAIGATAGAGYLAYRGLGALDEAVDVSETTPFPFRGSERALRLIGEAREVPRRIRGIPEQFRQYLGRGLRGVEVAYRRALGLDPLLEEDEVAERFNRLRASRLGGLTRGLAEGAFDVQQFRLRNRMGRMDVGGLTPESRLVAGRANIRTLGTQAMRMEGRLQPLPTETFGMAPGELEAMQGSQVRQIEALLGQWQATAQAVTEQERTRLGYVQQQVALAENQAMALAFMDPVQRRGVFRTFQRMEAGQDPTQIDMLRMTQFAGAFPRGTHLRFREAIMQEMLGTQIGRAMIGPTLPMQDMRDLGITEASTRAVEEMSKSFDSFLDGRTSKIDAKIDALSERLANLMQDIQAGRQLSGAMADSSGAQRTRGRE